MTKHLIELPGHDDLARDLSDRPETDRVMDQVTDHGAPFHLHERVTVMPEFEGP